MTAPHVSDLMTVPELAAYLRIRERTIYELVRTNRVPFARLSGKLLFPSRLIDLWIAQSAEYPEAMARLVAPPNVLAGSHDPLLEWAARESGCGLALLTGGSADGLMRVASGEATACGVHLVDVATGEQDFGDIARALGGVDFVVIGWARREQGLVLPPGNPLGIAGPADLARAGLRVARRQEGSGGAALMRRVLVEAGVDETDVGFVAAPVVTETGVGEAVRDGLADVGLAVRAAAQAYGLDFAPLRVERFDLVVRRVEYFDAPFQTLMAFARSTTFAARATAMGGYDVSGCGTVVLNPRR